VLDHALTGMIGDACVSADRTVTLQAG